MKSFTLEIVPSREIYQQLKNLPVGSRISVATLPNIGIKPTIETAIWLTQIGFIAIPHLPARAIESKEQLLQICNTLKKHGVDEILVIAGDREKPAGKYQSSTQLLDDLIESNIKFSSVGVAGFPEGHPYLNSKEEIKSLFLKQALEQRMNTKMYIATQMCSSSEILLNWMVSLRKKDIRLPVVVGLPGTVSKKVLRLFLDKHKIESFNDWLLSNEEVFNSSKLLQELISSLNKDNLGIQGFQIYTFNEVQKSAIWVEYLNRSS